MVGQVPLAVRLLSGARGAIVFGIVAPLAGGAALWVPMLISLSLGGGRNAAENIATAVLMSCVMSYVYGALPAILTGALAGVLGLHRAGLKGHVAAGLVGALAAMLYLHRAMRLDRGGLVPVILMALIPGVVGGMVGSTLLRRLLLRPTTNDAA